MKSLGFESYVGSLRGARGTLWSEAGNALDKSSLLIAMLRASETVRYRHGTLSTARAQEVITSMFPAVTQVVGHVPAGESVGYPVNDVTLQNEVKDHWWVEAYVAWSWLDMDTSFPLASVGQSFEASTSTDGTDRIAEVPDSQRHKVNLRVKVERYSTFAGLINYAYPLSQTFRTVEMAGNAVSLAHIVSKNGAGGFIFSVSTRQITSHIFWWVIRFIKALTFKML